MIKTVDTAKKHLPSLTFMTSPGIEFIALDPIFNIVFYKRFFQFTTLASKPFNCRPHHEILLLQE